MTLCAVNALILCTVYTTETLIIGLSLDESCVTLCTVEPPIKDSLY